MNQDPSQNPPDSPLDDDIDKSLLEQFRAPQAPAEHLADLLSAFESNASGSSNTPSKPQKNSARSFSRGQVLASLAVAACLLIAMGIWLPESWKSFNTEPVFEPVPLASLYEDAVQRGFTPYYDCSDDARFLTTMRHRHRVDLKIIDGDASDVDQPVRMLGVSYSGGLSRNSTVILFLVDEQPVMVFVDNEDVTVPPAVLDNSSNPTLSTYETRRDGLVFVEISPFDRPLATSTIEKIAD